ncbi:PREDICTED: uncharacterized protein LOC109342413 [Lupinus angustifolius]|uniref:uncharacterized protein LOC109342413 n=1 Tax=Lupinus angustifolius TaxID=3871 RepID=UPI00092FB162|nr:PREDICTED: uncharacterized protein LOC109342413 [Lupinus angustifolius]
MKSLLDFEFYIKDLGPLKYFLGMEIVRSSVGILLYQRKYTLDLLQDCGLLDAKPFSTPMEYSGKLIYSSSGVSLTDVTSYRRLMGKLLYLTHPRHDLSFVVGHLSQFLDKPTNYHYSATIRILKYLKGSISNGIFFSVTNNMQLKGYSDSNWAACLDTRRSTSGYCFFLRQSLVSWKSKKQKSVSRSCTEAEYRAMALASCEAQWLVSLLANLGLAHPQSVQLYCDNQSAMHIATNHVYHERTKHIEVDCHFIRERVQSKVIHLLLVSSSSQIADIFTKPLSPSLF